MDADDLQQRVEAFADRVVRVVERLPATIVGARAGGQLFDSATSSAANYRAARRARSHADFAAKIGIASEESDESHYWLGLLIRNGISTDAETKALLTEADELRRIFATSHRTAKSRRDRPR